MKIASLSLFILSFLVKSSVLAQLEFGIGHIRETSFLNGTNQVFVGDSIIFIDSESTTNPFGVINEVRNDLRMSFFCTYTLKSVTPNLKFQISLFYDKKWSTLYLVRLTDRENSFNAYHPIFLSKGTLFFPVNLQFTPFNNYSFLGLAFIKKLNLELGLGPAFHIGNNAQRIDYDLGLENNRRDPVYYETWYQYQKNAHKTFTWNYSLSVSTKIYKSFGLQITSSGNFGSFTKPFDVYGNEYDVPLKRRSVALFLTYEFDLP